MVDFIGYERAKEVCRVEPVVFAEIVAKHGGASALEAHVVAPDAGGLFEIEWDDTGPIRDTEIHDFVAGIAAVYGARYAAVYPVGNHWPPTDSTAA